MSRVSVRTAVVGLGKLGNFEGNGQHRDYLNNLGFIATQNRKGIWSLENQ